MGIVAALLLFNYVRGIENDANEDAKLVDVFSATADLPQGTSGDLAASDGGVASAKIPQEFKPATAITSTEEILRKVALFDIAQNTVIVQGMFVDPSQTQISFRARLTNPEHTAISISVDSVRGVGGFLVPGDEVNMMIKVDAPEDGTAACPGLVSTDGSCYRYLYQAVHILAVGSNTELTPGEEASEDTTTDSSSSGLITFNVPPEAARNIALAQDLGVYLTLVPRDYVPIPIVPTETVILPAEDPAQLTPYGPQGTDE